MNKKILIIVMFFVSIMFLSSLNLNEVNATTSYYNWVRNPSFESDINLCEDGSFESGVVNSGVLYGNWSGTGTYTGTTARTGVYRLYINTGTYQIYNLTESVLGADINQFSFYHKESSSGDILLTFYYSDYTTDTTGSGMLDGGSTVWDYEEVSDEIDDSKYLVAWKFQYVADTYSLDDVFCTIDDFQGQTEVSITSSPWGIYDFGEAFSAFFDVDWELGSDITSDQSHSGLNSFEFIEGEIAPIFQSVGWLDSDYIYYADMYVLTNNTDGVKIAFGLSYSDGRATGKNMTISYTGDWQHVIFSNFIYDNAYVTGITIYCFDESGNGDSTYIDDVGLWSTVNTDWKRFSYSVSPLPVSMGKSGFTALQRTTYTLTFNLYDENASQTESGSYQIVDGVYGLTSGTFTNGAFTKTLNQRVSGTVNSIEDSITIIVSVSGETIQLTLDCVWSYVSIPDDTDEANATNLVNWLAMFLIIFLPALLFAGGIYENNQQPDSMHISPAFGIIAGLMLSVGLGVYTGLVPLWLLIVMIVAVVIIVIGMVRH